MLPHKLSNKLLNLCPRMLLEPFTLDKLLSNKLGRIFDTVSFNQSENGIPNDVAAVGSAYSPIAAAENMTSLGIPFSDW